MDESETLLRFAVSRAMDVLLGIPAGIVDDPDVDELSPEDSSSHVASIAYKILEEALEGRVWP